VGIEELAYRSGPRPLSDQSVNGDVLVVGVAILIEIDSERGVLEVFVKTGGKDRQRREQDEANDEL
jgi:hypothetical protein